MGRLLSGLSSPAADRGDTSLSLRFTSLTVVLFISADFYNEKESPLQKCSFFPHFNSAKQSHDLKSSHWKAEGREGMVKKQHEGEKGIHPQSFHPNASLFYFRSLQRNSIKHTRKQAQGG